MNKFKLVTVISTMILCTMPNLSAIDVRLDNIDRRLMEVVGKLDALYAFVTKTEATASDEKRAAEERVRKAQVNGALGQVLLDVLRSESKTDEAVNAAMHDAVSKGFVVGGTSFERNLGLNLRYAEEDGIPMPKSKAYFVSLGGKLL